MAEIRDELELERLRNLVVGFGWSITNQEFKTDRIIVTLEMLRESKPGDESPGPS